MGDKIVIKNIEFLYGHLWQIDLYNETKNEHYRTFIKNDELGNKMEEALLSARLKESFEIKE